MPMRFDVAQTERHHLLDMIDFKDKRVLEIGTGNGRLAWRYADTAKQVIGIDVEVDPLREAIASRPDHLKNTVDFMMGSAIVMPFKSVSFDHVIFAWSL